MVTNDRALHEYELADLEMRKAFDTFFASFGCELRDFPTTRYVMFDKDVATEAAFIEPSASDAPNDTESQELDAAPSTSTGHSGIAGHAPTLKQAMSALHTLQCFFSAGDSVRASLGNVESSLVQLQLMNI